jgi:hypothetical protein
MQLLSAVDLFGHLPTAELQSLFPHDALPTCTSNECNARGLLVFFATAGVSLSGQLPDCDTLDDLRSAFEDFIVLWRNDIVSDEQWSDEATLIHGRACDWMHTATMQAATNDLKNSKYNKAELN